MFVPSLRRLLLCDLEHKLELLSETGVDYTVVVEFSKEQSEVPAEAFAKQVLVKCLQARAVVVGADFHFGKGRKGDVQTLREVGQNHDFEVVGLPLGETNNWRRRSDFIYVD